MSYSKVCKDTTGSDDELTKLAETSMNFFVHCFQQNLNLSVK